MMDQQGQYIIYNGELYPSDTKIATANSRVFRYGDGLFETMRIKEEVIMLSISHFRRLFRGMELLQFPEDSLINEQHLRRQISLLIRNNRHEKSSRIRLQVFRGECSLVDEDDFPLNYIIQSFNLPGHYNLNESETIIGIFRDAKKSCDKLSNIKSCNFLPFVLAAFYAKANGWDEALITNTYGRIAESTVANVFWIKNGNIYTPPLTEGCVAGVMRGYLVSLRDLNIVEKELSEEIMLSADEVFLTNAVNGMRCMDSIGNKKYQRKQSIELFHDYIENIQG